MKILVGLGNPGKEYEKNRHNAGFILLDKFAKEKGLDWNREDKFKAEVAKAGDLLLIKPQTFMNNSGESVSLILGYYKVLPADFTIIHDDVDLEFGRIKSQLGGSSAGHHGIENIIQKIGTSEFNRVRVGIGRPSDNRFDVMNWVLSDFSEEELNTLNTIEVGEYWS